MTFNVICMHHLRVHFPQFKSVLFIPLWLSFHTVDSRPISYVTVYPFFFCLNFNSIQFNLLNGLKIDLRIFVVCWAFIVEAVWNTWKSYTYFVWSFPNCTHEWTKYFRCNFIIRSFFIFPLFDLSSIFPNTHRFIVSSSFRHFIMSIFFFSLCICSYRQTRVYPFVSFNQQTVKNNRLARDLCFEFFLYTLAVSDADINSNWHTE